MMCALVPARVPVERPGGGLGELLFIQPWQGADDLWMAWGRPAKRLAGRFLRKARSVTCVSTLSGLPPVAFWSV